jgi:ornithine cyclodeaminase/alanine dehydrogenase-like protein (mu-crystallin family)
MNLQLHSRAKSFVVLLSLCLTLPNAAWAQLPQNEDKKVVPQRIGIDTPLGTTLVMPAYLPSQGDLAVKIVSVYRGNGERYIQAINGLVVVLDDQTGRPSVIMDGGTLTALHTGAASDFISSIYLTAVSEKAAGGCISQK